MDEIIRLKRKAIEIRRALLTMIHEAGAGHTGGALSCTDILTALFYGVLRIDPANPKWEDRDRYVQSKGHSVEPYWAILADLGFFPPEELRTFSRYGSRLIGHPNNKVPGVEMNTGALGHGLPISVGMALAGKMDRKDYKVYTLMGDGELAEGSIWEAAMAAAHYGLDNLVAIIDRNRLQITGPTEDVMSLEPLADKWRAFGWKTVEVDGHDFGELLGALRAEPDQGKPTVIIANTVKGKGLSLAENQVHWHHRVPTKEEYDHAMVELTRQMEELE